MPAMIGDADIVERARDLAEWLDDGDEAQNRNASTVNEIADELLRLRAVNAALQSTLVELRARADLAERQAKAVRVDADRHKTFHDALWSIANELPRQHLQPLAFQRAATALAHRVLGEAVVPTRRLEGPLDEKIVRRDARAFGPLCASARAVASLDERRSRGERVSIYRDQDDDALVVGPTMPPPPEGTADA
jgi:hypothetical protein